MIVYHLLLSIFRFYGPMDLDGGFSFGRNFVRGLGIIFAVRRNSRFFFVRFVLRERGFRVSSRCRVRNRIHMRTNGRIADYGLANGRNMAEYAVRKKNDA